jgi:cytochrome b
MKTTNDRGALVWDAPVRIFHWLLVACFAGAWLTAESERWRLAHVTLGYTMAALVAFRVVWGFIGTRHARFADFVRRPNAIWQYLRALRSGRPEHHAGHNPAGALAILALLVLILTTAASGFATYSDLGGEWLEELHETAANTLLAVVGVHLLGVVVGSLAHRENLVRAMVTGRKHVPPSEGIRNAWRSVAVLMVAATLGFWVWQWQAAPAAGDTASASATIRAHQGKDRDRD